MKINRPALAAVAAIAIAAGAVPAASHLTAAPLGEPEVSFPTAEIVPAAEVTEVGPDQPAANPPAGPELEGTPAAEAPALEQAPKNDSQALEEAIVKDAENARASTPEEQQNMPELVAAAASAGAPQRLAAAPQDYQGKAQEWFGKIKGNNNWEALKVYSPSMERDIPVAVRWAEDGENKRIPGAPTVYLLNGAGGSEQNTDWVAKALDQVESTFGGQGVNLVIPMEGAFSYYVDWLEEPTKNSYYHGKQMWTTFLGDELPQSIEPYLGANDKRAVVGFSMSATSSLLLAEQRSGKYAAVGSFSGCPATSTPLPWFATELTLNRGGATPQQVWGPMGSDYNRYNDALVNAEKLAGTELYITNGSGLAGETDMVGYFLGKKASPQQASANAQTLQIEGGVIEGMTNACTHDLRAKLNSKGIDATFKFRNTGTHSWPYWLDDLSDSWVSVIGPALTGKTSEELGPK